MTKVHWILGNMIWYAESFSEGRSYAAAWSGATTLSVGEDYDSYVFSYRSHSWKGSL